MVVRITVKVKRKGNAAHWLAGFARRASGPRGVKVGFPAGTTGKHGSGLVDIVQIAIWNHFGTAGSGKGFSKEARGGKTMGGFGGPIPPRPFITVAVFRHRAELRRRLRAIYVDMLHGRTTAEIGLQRLGQYGVGIIQQTITGGGFAPNSPLTIALKGSSKPLMDTGQMNSSVTFALDGAGQAASGGRSAAYQTGHAAGRAFGRALARMFK